MSYLAFFSMNYDIIIINYYILFWKLITLIQLLTFENSIQYTYDISTYFKKKNIGYENKQL